MAPRKERDLLPRDTGNEEEETGRELQSVSDDVLQETIQKLVRRKEKLEKLDEHLKEALSLKVERGMISKAMMKTLHALVPRGWYKRLPASMVKYCAEEGDVLELIETLQRDNLNGIQLELRITAACALAKRAEMEQLEQDLQRAEKENWNAKKLQAFMTRRANIPLYKEVALLLDEEFKALSDEQKEERKQYLLKKFHAQVNLGFELVSTMSVVCSGGLQVFHTAVVQYVDFVNVMKPAQKMRDIARRLTDTNTAMYAAPDAIRETFRETIQTLKVAIDAARKVEQYSISSGDIKSLLKDGRTELEQQRLGFNQESATSEDEQ